MGLRNILGRDDLVSMMEFGGRSVVKRCSAQQPYRVLAVGGQHAQCTQVADDHRPAAEVRTAGEDQLDTNHLIAVLEQISLF